jgi:hypothetical protein
MYSARRGNFRFLWLMTSGIRYASMHGDELRSDELRSQAFLVSGIPTRRQLGETKLNELPSPNVSEAYDCGRNQ